VAKANSGITLTNSGDIATTGDLSAGIDVRSAALHWQFRRRHTKSVDSQRWRDRSAFGHPAVGLHHHAGISCVSQHIAQLKNTGRVVTDAQCARAPRRRHGTGSAGQLAQACDATSIRHGQQWRPDGFG